MWESREVKPLRLPALGLLAEQALLENAAQN
jgi:hypothetical protein